MSRNTNQTGRHREESGRREQAPRMADREPLCDEHAGRSSIKRSSGRHKDDDQRQESG